MKTHIDLTCPWHSSALSSWCWIPCIPTAHQQKSAMSFPKVLPRGLWLFWESQHSWKWRKNQVVFTRWMWNGLHKDFCSIPWTCKRRRIIKSVTMLQVSLGLGKREKYGNNWSSNVDRVAFNSSKDEGCNCMCNFKAHNILFYAQTSVLGSEQSVI